VNVLKIEYVATDDLIPYINNSRTHSESQIKQIAASIREFGFTNPILIDEGGSVIAGHGRLVAAELLDLDEVPTITLEGLTEAQRKAYVIADNKLALNSGWDDELLKIEIETLKNLDFDTDLLGWDILPQITEAPDYSMLDDEDVSEVMGEMTDNVKKAIQIEFELSDYEEASEIVKFWRNSGAYVGGIILTFLKAEKNKL
tara:strand:+ start:615 stop:1217 length:603 start_codon:yes stop_codon:yes gene_type:complete